MAKTARNDSVLDTGMTSAAARRAMQRTREQQDKRAGVRQQLTPGADIILEWIDKEIKDCADLTKMIMNVDSEEKVQAQLLAKQYHIVFLKEMKNRVKNTLRQAKKADKEAKKAADAEAPEAWKVAAETPAPAKPKKKVAKK